MFIITEMSIYFENKDCWTIEDKVENAWIYYLRKKVKHDFMLTKISQKNQCTKIKVLLDLNSHISNIHWYNLYINQVKWCII